jgi:hypothetical protein
VIETILTSSVANRSIDFLGRTIVSKWKAHKQMGDLLGIHKRRILAARVTSSIYYELHLLRASFLQYSLTERNEANRRFFEEWLSDPVIELGLTPSGGWTLDRIAALHADLGGLRA